MTPTATTGRKEWQAADYAPGRGKTAAQAIGLKCLGHHVKECAAEDMQILGLDALPDPRPWTWPVTKGTDEERKARVDTWAARHGTTAHPDEATGHYRAVLGFGPAQIVVYMIPDAVMADRVKAATERVAELHRAVAEVTA